MHGLTHTISSENLVRIRLLMDDDQNIRRIKISAEGLEVNWRVEGLYKLLIPLIEKRIKRNVTFKRGTVWYNLTFWLNKRSKFFKHTNEELINLF